MGPLTGIKIVEFASIGPGPFCAMLLADLGAEIIRLERPGDDQTDLSLAYDFLKRSRRALCVDLKKPADRQLALQLLSQADALIEGFRPGVMERLRLGPDECLRHNPRLVYGRMTGWGQDGPFAARAGHDINYIATSGALHAIGNDQPVVPLNLVGDFAGGAMYLAVGVLSALLETKSSGKGQVVDAAMCDGAVHLMTMLYSLHANGRWQDQRNSNFLDGAAHFYRTYQCADGKFIAIGAIEPKFYQRLLSQVGLDPAEFSDPMTPERWPSLSHRLATVFKQKDRQTWCTLLQDSDVCFAPVLSMREAPDFAHNKHRQNFVKFDGVVQPAPAPRFSRTPGQIQSGPAVAADTNREETIADWLGTQR